MPTKFTRKDIVNHEIFGESEFLTYDSNPLYSTIISGRGVKRVLSSDLTLVKASKDAELEQYKRRKDTGKLDLSDLYYLLKHNEIHDDNIWGSQQTKWSGELRDLIGTKILRCPICFGKDLRELVMSGMRKTVGKRYVCNTCYHEWEEK